MWMLILVKLYISSTDTNTIVEVCIKIVKDITSLTTWPSNLEIAYTQMEK